ncbi:Cysteine-rich secretory protein family [Phytophthora infestans]|uniref:Cysteine-rich secretory protein family n=1 Tax=Phytophthora infestans TaxID=4787 RepID=A0A833SZE2_PHYIN|nr:Cysteine-rich secretory protein family [Phytophthora infestans]KAF4145492.1 Cysteine-rich secretory protein family [Phytophthora infestans]
MSSPVQHCQYSKSTFLLCALLIALICNTATAIDDDVAPEHNATNVTVRDLQTQSGFQALLLAAVNKERAAVGLPSLCMNTKLQSAAQKHSKDMAANNYMSHTGSSGSSMSQRITASGFKWTAVAENVAAGQMDAAAVMKAWMNSPGHRKNILGSKYKMLGCGYAYNANAVYKRYWAQEFGTGSSESCS